MSNNSSSERSAGLIMGWAPHYIDHLAPLCHFLHIPLIVTEEDLAKTIAAFYPTIALHCCPILALPEALIEAVDLLFTCTPRILIDEAFFLAQTLHKKKIHSVWCPHGNSDKGHLACHMEALDKEEASLVYGEKMVDFLKQKGSFSQLKQVLQIGNFRLHYYKAHQSFYDDLVEKTIFSHLPKAEKTILYAPTWQDAESSSSFFEATKHLIENLPSFWNLIIKPHPNLALNDETAYINLVELSKKHENILFLTEFPPIYPLLAKIDIYLGDLSSIGYDFLFFDKPMFFLNQQNRSKEKDPGLYLFQCGTEIQPKDYSSIYTILQKSLLSDSKFSFIRKKIYDYTFASDPPFLKENTLTPLYETFFPCQTTL